MDLGFPEIVEVIRHIKMIEIGKDLIDAEVAALQCAWHGINYKEFSENQETFAQKYPKCYKNPARSKRAGSLSSCGSSLYRLLAKFFGIERLSRVEFRRKIKGLLDESVAKGQLIPIHEILEGRENLNISHQNLNQSVILTQDVENIIARIDSSPPILSIFGARGIGKTTVLDYIARNNYSNKDYQYIYTDLRYIESFTQWAFEVLAQTSLDIEDSEEILMSLFRLFESKNVLLIMDSIIYLDRAFLGFLEAFAVRNMSSKSIIILSSFKNINFNIDASRLQKYKMIGLQNIQNINNYFRRLGLHGEEYWRQMSDFYGGNFRDIQYAADFILTFFAGDVGKYWNSGSKFISKASIEEYELANFTPLDIEIFMMIGDEDQAISTGFVNAFKKDSRTSEIWSRISYLSELGYLIQRRDPKSNIISYSVPTLLQCYLKQESIFEFR